MKLFARYIFLALLLVQVLCIAYFLHWDTDSFGIYNTDSFSYHISWSKASKTLNPFGEPVLKDPGYEIKRLLFSLPHLVMAFTTVFFTPMQTFLIWCCLGVLLNYFSLYWFARALNFSPTAAHVAALLHYTFFHIFSQLPPLSLNQINYIIQALTQDPETLLHFGPRQYPHDIFLYPLLYTLLAVTITGVRKLQQKQNIAVSSLVLWIVLAIALPFCYFYHWFEYAGILGIVIGAGLLLKWWKLPDFVGQYRPVALSVIAIGVVWIGAVILQRAELSSPEGIRFALVGGLTEARFLYLPVGFIVRLVLWTTLLLAVLKVKPESMVLAAYLLACFLLMNMQLVVGKTIQPGHWSFGVDRVYGWILLLILHRKVWPRFTGPTAKYLKPAAIIIGLIFFTLQSSASWKSFAQFSKWDKDRTALITYLKTLPTAVVLVPEIWLETDVLIHTPHYGFLPRAAQSAIGIQEHIERLTHAALLLEYSKEGFNRWVHIRPGRFFAMLYRTEKEFSSSLYYDPVKRPEVLKFAAGQLPAWDEKIMSDYLLTPATLQKQLDLIILHRCESLPATMTEILYQNDNYRVIKANPLSEKHWGVQMPINEQKYPLNEASCRESKQ